MELRRLDCLRAHGRAVLTFFRTLQTVIDTTIVGRTAGGEGALARFGNQDHSGIIQASSNVGLINERPALLCR